MQGLIKPFLVGQGAQILTFSLYCICAFLLHRLDLGSWLTGRPFLPFISLSLLSFLLAVSSLFFYTSFSLTHSPRPPQRIYIHKRTIFRQT